MDVVSANASYLPLVHKLCFQMVAQAICPGMHQPTTIAVLLKVAEADGDTPIVSDTLLLHRVGVRQ